MEEKKDIWFHWKNLTQKRVHPDDLTEEDLIGYNTFQMNKILSSVNIYLPDVAELTMYDLPKEVHYRYLDNLLPKSYIKVTYPKSRLKEEDAEYVKKYFEFGTRDLKYAMRILSEKNVNDIRKKFGRC